MIKLSIITVNLNNVSGLKKTIDSVVSQTYRDFEWIVIDGGSTDGSRELIEEFSSHFAYCISEPDKGIYNAMNKGVDHAQGEYCQFLNSGDCLADTDVLEKVSDKLTDYDILYGNVNLVRDNKYIQAHQYSDYLYFDDLYFSTLCHNSSFIKTELLKTNPYDEAYRIVSDWKLFFQLFLENKTFVHIDKTICCYDMSGISENNPELLEKERKQVISELSPLIVTYLMDQKKETESHLAHTPMDVFNTLCRRHRLFAKSITALLILMRKIK